MALPNINKSAFTVRRIQIWYAFLAVIVMLFGLRLFYVQVIRYKYYKTAALSDQLKQYQIPANRGIIEAYDGGKVVPIVLNQTFYTLYADPPFIKNSSEIATKIAAIIGGDATTYESQMKVANTQYSVLANKITEAQSNAILALKNPGVGTEPEDYRVYPQGSLASQVLGFVNNQGKGEYGVEQFENNELAGTAGKIKAITDVNGVPLAATKGNVESAPKNGDNLVLTLNLSMQEQMEQIIQNEYKKTNSQGISALIMDPNTGQVEAMANYPTYDPSNYQNVSDPNLFDNGAVTDSIEPGSSMKTLTTAAALDQGVITPNESFYDPAHWDVDGFNITDIEQDGGARQQNIASILSLSLNTGATWELMQMSDPGGTQINQKGIDAWYKYMVNRFRLGEPTGIEQGYQASGYVPKPDMSDPSISLTYANTAFGQGVQVTPIQMGAALSSVLNGGTYYQPTLISQTISPSGAVTANMPDVVERNTVSSKIGPELIPLMENVVKTYLGEGFSYMSFSPDYMVGGKTGTAQIAQQGGGYSSTIFNGTYVGFVGGDKPQYVIVVFNNKPNVAGYAGSEGGQPVFADLAHMLINEGFVTPKTVQ